MLPACVKIQQLSLALVLTVNGQSAPIFGKKDQPFKAQGPQHYLACPDAVMN